MIPALVRTALYLLCAGSTAYALLAIAAAREFFREEPPAEPSVFPPISILKPIRGEDEDAEENFRTFAEQDYPEFQLLFGALDRDDAGLGAARRIAEAHPELDVEIVAGGDRAGGNPKVANLANLARRARHRLLLVSDSDVRAPRGYLRRIAAAAEDPDVGVVTSPYRSNGRGWGGVLQALGNATEFQPSVFVARKLEGLRFALGAGILLRRDVLDEVGGFAAIGPFLADDLMLGRLPARAGRRVVLSLPVLDHELGHVTLAAYARRQIRWNRGIRAARPGGYTGLLVTQSTVLALLLLAATAVSPAGTAVAAAAIASRLAMGWMIGAAALGDASVRRGIALVPLRDVAAFLLWVAGFFGRTVEWRGERYRIGRGGRIAPERPR
jgi:ceramide glucosyltransferase